MDEHGTEVGHETEEQALQEPGTYVDIDDDEEEEDSIKGQQNLIEASIPRTSLEIALSDECVRKDLYIRRLTGEVMKLKTFICKRKQTYKRKRKDEDAPTRPLSAYNIFVQDRFSLLAKENEAALKCDDTDTQLKRVIPASLVASTGPQWRALSTEEKGYYAERAQVDRERYDQQMTTYQVPDKQSNRRRNKTAYNMFFSAHVMHIKQSEAGVPSERGYMARLVGSAWKELSPEQKQYYEQEANKQNIMNSANEDADLNKKNDRNRADYPQGAPMHDPHMHRPHAVMHPQMGHMPVAHQPHHDPRSHYPPHHHAPPPHNSAYPGYYDYHQPLLPPPDGNRERSAQQHHSGYNYPPPHYPPYPDQGQDM